MPYGARLNTGEQEGTFVVGETWVRFGRRVMETCEGIIVSLEVETLRPEKVGSHIEPYGFERQNLQLICC